MSAPRILVLDSRTVSPDEVAVPNDINSSRPWAYLLGLSELGLPDLAKCGSEAGALLGAIVFPAVRLREGDTTTTVRATLEPEGFSIGLNFLVSGEESELESVRTTFRARESESRKSRIRERLGKAPLPVPRCWATDLLEEYPRVPEIPREVTLWRGMYNVFGHVCLVFPPDLDRFLEETLAPLLGSGLAQQVDSTRGVYVD